MELFGIDIKELLIHAGIWSAFVIIFAESGLLIGFFLPGDSLIFTAGLLAAQGYFPIWYLLIGGTIAAIVGDNVGYQFGRKYGHRVFNKEESVFFHKDHVKRAEEFYKKHGPLTIVLARFTPVVRTFAPILAGVGKMEYRTFLLYNIAGGFLWVWGLGFLGYFLADIAERNNIDVDRYILPVVAGIVILSVIPGLVAVIRNRKKS